MRKNISSPLAPRHFRNQLRLLSQRSAYRDFRELAEASWPGLQVRALRGARGGIGAELFLGIRDRDFVAEVARMGHGLQMWLQTMWFLARTPPTASVVLDEPDVYMHPDLQRRMIRLVRDASSRFLSRLTPSRSWRKSHRRIRSLSTDGLRVVPQFEISPEENEDAR